MKADITIKQVTDPSDRYCSSGHIAEETFKADHNIMPNRFFSIIGNNINGIYCESCLFLANNVKRSKK